MTAAPPPPPPATRRAGRPWRRSGRRPARRAERARTPADHVYTAALVVAAVASGVSMGILLLDGSPTPPAPLDGTRIDGGPTEAPRRHEPRP